MESMTREEIIAKAKEVFGEEVQVRYSINGWTIHTEIEEKFEEDKYRDRAAWEMYENIYYGERELDRWARKNGYGGLSTADLFDAYDEYVQDINLRQVKEVRDRIAADFPFDETGLGDYRDRVLAWAEENGV